jgi:hypothetical protein
MDLKATQQSLYLGPPIVLMYWILHCGGLADLIAL